MVADLATYQLANQMNISAAIVPAGVDEMKLAGLEAAPSTMVRPLSVAASPAALECKLLGITELVGLDGQPTDWYLIAGQVVGVHIDPAYLKDGIFDSSMARNLARCGCRGRGQPAGTRELPGG